MTTLSVALEATDKERIARMYDEKDSDNIVYLLKHALTQESEEELAKFFSVEEIIMIILERDRLRALDWIAKALPFMKLDLERRRFADYDDGENRAYGDRDIATLTALIAQAEGTEKEGENA